MNTVQEIQKFVVGLKEMGSLPGVALQVIEKAGDDEADLGQIRRLIESDQGLASRVLKVANAPCLGFPGKVSTLERATALMGLEMVRNITLSVMIAQFFESRSDSGHFSLSDIWYHNLACAVASEEIARRTRLCNPREAFVIGLLHDLGKMVLLRWNDTIYQAVAAKADAMHVDLVAMEREVLGTDHAEVGQWLLEDWNFPARLARIVGLHHMEKLSDLGEMGTVVAAANQLCHLRRFGYSGYRNPTAQLSDISRHTRLSENELDEISYEVLSEFDEVASLFSDNGNAPQLYLSAVNRANTELSEMYQKLLERGREQEKIEKELRAKEEQLNRSQRLEAVGHLAGGVAHDFNNFLTIIMGFGDLLREGVEENSTLKQHVETIMAAAERAATLTQQLLAFSRRQVLKPKVLDLNEVVADVERLLVRLIGEDVQLTTRLDPEVWPIRVDPGGIEQVIVNLAVNARDAMQDGGLLIIETQNITLKQPVEGDLGQAAAADYVRLRIADTGHGMTRETRERIFEPFFTTKKKGTGMGLATVYGIVKQSGGFIQVESEPSSGTEFSILFEPLQEMPDRRTEPEVEVARHEGNETILVAEDEREILELVQRVLISVGYEVLAAEDGEAAYNLAEKHPGRIDLLLTDAVMPNMNGRELMERLRPQRPNMKILVMSGYTASNVLHRGIAGQDVAFLAKPFSPSELIKRVQSVLEED